MLVLALEAKRYVAGSANVQTIDKELKLESYTSKSRQSASEVGRPYECSIQNPLKNGAKILRSLTYPWPEMPNNFLASESFLDTTTWLRYIQKVFIVCMYNIL